MSNDQRVCAHPAFYTPDMFHQPKPYGSCPLCEVERLRVALRPFAVAAEHGAARWQLLDKGGVDVMGCRDGFMDKAKSYLCVRDFNDARTALKETP